MQMMQMVTWNGESFWLDLKPEINDPRQTNNNRRSKYLNASKLDNQIILSLLIRNIKVKLVRLYKIVESNLWSLLVGNKVTRNWTAISSSLPQF